MKKRRIGESDLTVVPLCLGGNVFGWTIDEARSFEVLDAFMALGGNFIDTADVYATWAPGNSGGESETILGAWMKARGNRSQVILATKLGSKMGDGKEGLSAAYMVQAVEASLKRLQTDYIDLYQAHIDDAGTPLEETMVAFDQLVRAGKVRVLGASNYSGARMSEALAISTKLNLARYECVQPFYNLVRREEYEQDLEPVLLANQIGCIPYSTLASGFLSGKYRTGAPMPQTPRAGGVQQRYMNEAGFVVLAQVEALAKQVSATPAQVALAGLMARPSITAPIASATSVAQLKELMGALAVQLPA